MALYGSILGVVMSELHRPTVRYSVRLQ